jgi:hypothetical protein
MARRRSRDRRGLRACRREPFESGLSRPRRLQKRRRRRDLEEGASARRTANGVAVGSPLLADEGIVPVVVQEVDVDRLRHRVEGAGKLIVRPRLVRDVLGVRVEEHPVQRVRAVTETIEGVFGPAAQVVAVIARARSGTSVVRDLVAVGEHSGGLASETAAENGRKNERGDEQRDFRHPISPNGASRQGSIRRFLERGG